jgi:hypothetical protein
MGEEPPDAAAAAPAPPVPAAPKGTIIEKVFTQEQIANAPTLFGAMGMEQNRRVLWTFAGISVLLVVAGFGVFFVGRELIPVCFPSISRYDSPIYSCAAAVVVTQAIIFAFYFWAWKHDVAEERAERAQKKVD